VVECVIRLTESSAAHGEVFNIGSDELVTIRGLAEQIIAKTNPDLTIRYIPYREAYGEGFEDVRQRVPDLTRLRTALGMQPSRSLSEILDDVIAWKRSQRTGKLT
jgi:UDP-glucose 4-epimerase